MERSLRAGAASGRGPEPGWERARAGPRYGRGSRGPGVSRGEVGGVRRSPSHCWRVKSLCPLSPLGSPQAERGARPAPSRGGGVGHGRPGPPPARGAGAARGAAGWVLLGLGVAGGRVGVRGEELPPSVRPGGPRRRGGLLGRRFAPVARQRHRAPGGALKTLGLELAGHRESGARHCWAFSAIRGAGFAHLLPPESVSYLSVLCCPPPDPASLRSGGVWSGRGYYVWAVKAGGDKQR